MKNNKNIYQTKFDNQLRQINTLKWLPWIAEDFANTKIKLLVVGESHYEGGKKEEKYENKQYTRIIHKETAVERNYYNIKVYPNFHRAMFGNDNFDAEKFWNKTAYYNFIQRPMFTNKDRPTEQDNKIGWETFVDLVTILKPDICIFLGTSSANSFNEIMQSKNIEHKKVRWRKKISNSYPKVSEITISKQLTKLIFIRHPSQYFSWQKWNEFLKTEMSEYF